MKKAVFISCVVLLLAAIPAEAQERRPFLRRFISSPVVHALYNYAFQNFLPGVPMPDLSSLMRDTSSTSKILVDSSVTRNLEVTRENLREADDIIQALMEKNKLSTAKKKTQVKTKD